MFVPGGRRPLPEPEVQRRARTGHAAWLLLDGVVIIVGLGLGC